MADRVTAAEAARSWHELKETLRGSILTDATAHALVTAADTVIEILEDEIRHLRGYSTELAELADYACGVPTGGDSTCRRVI